MKKILTAFIAILFVTLVAAAQQLDRDCNPVGVPAACEDEKQAVEEIETRLDRAQQQLQGASPARKPALIRRIESINAELDTAKAALNRCIRENSPAGPEVHPEALTARAVGTAIVETSYSKARGPYQVDFDVDIRFSPNRCHVVVTRFPRIRLDAGLVNVDVTQIETSTGGYHPISRTMGITLHLHFHYRNPLLGDDNANFELTNYGSVTRNNGDIIIGANLDLDGNLKLVGSGRFRKGFLAGETGRLIITARLSPHP